MTMYEQSQQSDWLQTELESMSLQADSPAKTSQSQDSKREYRTERAVDYGQSAPVLLGSFDPDTQSLRTSQTCLMENGEIGLSEYSETFPRSGMMRSGTVYQLPRLAPTTAETESGLWPTPTAMTGGEGIAPSHLDGSHGWSLGAAAKDSLSQEPVRMWPTPNEDAAGTPNGKMQKMLGNHPSLRGDTPEEWARGTLNPTWVEWLMGFPLGHTDLNA